MASDVTRRNFLGATGTLAAGISGAAAMTASNAQAGESAPGGPLKILGICCSYRKGKTTAGAMRACLDAARAVSPRIEGS
jgi:hypothetical protein